MKGKKPSVAEDRSRFSDFVRNAKSFEEEAKVAYDAGRWNPAGALYILAAIAWCDAVTIRFGGKRHTGDNHAGAASLLLEVVTADPHGKKEAAKNFRLIVSEKTIVSYSGESFSEQQIKGIRKRYQLFVLWCRASLDSVPRL